MLHLLLLVILIIGFFLHIIMDDNNKINQDEYFYQNQIKLNQNNFPKQKTIYNNTNISQNYYNLDNQNHIPHDNNQISQFAQPTDNINIYLKPKNNSDYNINNNIYLTTQQNNIFLKLMIK